MPRFAVSFPPFSLIVAAGLTVSRWLARDIAAVSNSLARSDLRSGVVATALCEEYRGPRLSGSAVREDHGRLPPHEASTACCFVQRSFRTRVLQARVPLRGAEEYDVAL